MLGVLNPIEIEQLLHSDVIGGIGCISGGALSRADLLRIRRRLSMDTPSPV